MNRGRASARGTRRGAAAAGSRATGESSVDPSTAQATSGSATPAPQSISSTPTRGGNTTRATRAPTAGRFRPKNVRRDEAERDSLARQEEQKASERAADERKARGRSRFRSKRSRGDAMGRGGFGRGISGASGPFSSGAAGSSGRGSGGWFGGGGGGGFGGGGGGGRGFKSDSKSGFAQATRNREARINADKLHLHTPEEDLDSEDEAMMEALNSRTVSVLPMGIYRREHKDEGIVVATTAELEAAENAQAIPPSAAKEEESLWVDGDAGESQPTDENGEDGGIWDNESKPPVIKKEQDDSMDLDLESKMDTETESKETSATPAPQAKKPAQESEETMIQADLDVLANELGAVEISEGAEGEEGKTQGPSNKDGRMYLFQFPPVLPPLKQVIQPKSTKIKPEPTEGEDDVLESTPAAADADPVDLTNDSNSNGFNIPGFEDPEQKAGFMSSLLSSGGMVGQLKVRKSGRVEMDWGGSTMELSPAVGMNFLTTAVIIEENDEKPRPGVVGGESIGMGKIMGRFVLAPKWDEEEEWEVSSEDLRTQ